MQTTESLYNEYKKTINWLAGLYGLAGTPISLHDDNEWMEFSSFLSVDLDSLKNSIHGNETEIEGGLDYYTYSLFYVFIKTFRAVKTIKEIEGWSEITKDNVRIIVNLLSQLERLMEGINSDISITMCMDKGILTRQYALNEWIGYSSHTEIERIRLCIDDLEPETSDHYDAILLIIKSVLSDLGNRINALFIVGVLLIISKSPVYDSDIKAIALELFEYLMFILKNGRLIGMQINCLYPNPNIDSEDRGKDDNTTQLLIVSELVNHDSYCLRLDLSHKGVNYCHYNNRSPGNGNDWVECCLFSFSEYEYILSIYPEFLWQKNYFIEYENKVALKEKNNCMFESPEEEHIYDKIANSHSHIPVFSKEYSEESIINFIKILSFSFPSVNSKEIDTSFEFAKKCFNYSTIMTYVWLLNKKALRPSLDGAANDDIDIDKLLHAIVNAAERYGLLDRLEDNSDFYSLSAISLIVDAAKDRITPLFL